MESDDCKAMSREAQLHQAADAWADFYKHDENMCDYISIRVAFREGAAWADEHPDLSTLWHSADEEPNNGTHILMERNYLDSKTFESYNIDFVGVVKWEALKKYFRISRWAYVKDLFPKGGEEL